MSKINKSNLEKYAQLKADEKRVEEEIKKLGPIIKSEMEGLGVEEVESDWGMFSFVKRRTWTYPENVVKLESDYKTAKKESEQKGTASYDEANTLMFKAKKSDE